MICGHCLGHHLRDCHTFGCPVYAQQNALQAGNALPKWNPRARLGVNLGPSQKKGNVYLVLNPTTGLVSPQYHVSFDDFFKAVQTPETSIQPTWKVLSGFEKPLGGDTGRTPHGGALYGTSMDPPVVSPAQNATFMQQDPTFDSVADHDDVSIALEDVPTGDMRTTDAMPQPPPTIQAPQTPGSQTPLPAPTHNPSHHFGTSSRGRQRTMSRRMQDATADGYLRNFTQAMAAYTPDNIPIFLGNDFCARHDYELGLQE